MNNNDDLINDILSELDNKKDMPAEETQTDISNEHEKAEQDTPVISEMIQQRSKDDPIPEKSILPHRSEADYSDRDTQYMQNRQYDQQNELSRKNIKKKRKKKRNRLPGVLILTTFIFAVSICLSMVIIAFGKDMLGIGKSDTPRTITITDGITTEEIAQLLKDEGIIKSPKCFMMFSKLRKSDSLYIPGEYLIRPNMAYETIIKKFTTNESANKEIIDVTFPEGITLYDAAALLEENGVCSADDFIFRFNSERFSLDFESRLPKDFSGKFLRMEGYLFPDTYFFYKEMDPIEVCQKIYITFNKRMNEVKCYEKMQKLGVSLDEVITLASIVQKEAANTADMKKIASVFWNRLHNSAEYPKLESDPTSNYANKVLKPHMDVINKTILDSYDTYIGPGLPPGAICNPGIEAIDAVLNPETTDYYFFYSNLRTGETLFAKTNEEHEQNIALVEQQNAEAQAAQGGAN